MQSIVLTSFCLLIYAFKYIFSCYFLNTENKQVENYFKPWITAKGPGATSPLQPQATPIRGTALFPETASP